MPAPIPLEPPVTSATLPLNDFACVAAIDILLVLTFCVLDSSVQNATQEVFCQGVDFIVLEIQSVTSEVAGSNPVGSANKLLPLNKLASPKGANFLFCDSVL